MYENNRKYSYFDEQRQFYLMMMMLILANIFGNTFEDIRAVWSSKNLWLKSCLCQYKVTELLHKMARKEFRNIYTSTHITAMLPTGVAVYMILDHSPSFGMGFYFFYATTCSLAFWCPFVIELVTHWQITVQIRALSKPLTVHRCKWWMPGVGTLCMCKHIIRL